MVSNDINQRLGEIDAELEALAALTEPTEDDASRSDALEAEGVELRKARQEAIERAQRIAENRRKAQEEGRTIAGASFHQLKIEPYDVDVRTLNPSEVRDAARSILDRVEARHLSADQKQHVDGLLTRMGPRMSQLMVAGSKPAYRSAFGKHVTGREAMWTNDEIRAVEEVRALALGDTTGGFAVPPLVDPSVILTSAGSVNPMRQVARIVTGIDDTWRGVTSAGVTASWDSEGVEVSDDAPTLAQPTVVAHKAQAFVPFSVEIEGDWQGMAGDLAMMFQDAKDNLETTAFATGSGTERPFGILTDLFAASSTAGVLPTTDGAFGAVDLRSIYGALGPRHRANAAFMGSIDALNEIRGFGSGEGIANATVDLTAPYEFQLLGRPFYENSAFPDFSGTTGAANILVVGDFKNYVIFDRVGSRTELVPHLFGSNRRPTGQRGLLFWWRVGGKTINTGGFKLLLNA